MKNIKQILENIGQTFFFPHWHMGILVLGALVLSNPLLILYSLLCLFSCQKTIKLLKGNQLLTLKGFVDVNAIFTGASIGYFFETNIMILGLCLLAGSFVAYFIILFQRILSPWQLPLLILPFLCVFQFFWIIKDYTPHFALKKHDLITTSIIPQRYPLDFINIEGSLRSFSQIFFSNSLILSILILIGLFALSKKLFFVMISSSFLGNLVASSIGFSNSDISNGLLGFNSILVGAAYLGLEEEFKWPKLFFLVTLTSLLGPVSHILLTKLGLLSLSLPYVLMIWSMQLTKSRSAHTYSTTTKRKDWLIQQE